MDYSADQVRELAKQEESETLEFKTSPPDALSVARLISAFANTSGGVVMVGVGPHGEIVGTDANRVAEGVTRSLSQVVPAPTVDVRTVDVDGKHVSLISVGKSAHVTVSDGGAFRREGERITPMTAADITARLKRQGVPESEVQGMGLAIARLTTTVEALEARIEYANSFRGQLTNYLVSGLIGAVIGVVMTALVSLF